jgi:hypothetical protein
LEHIAASDEILGNVRGDEKRGDAATRILLKESIEFLFLVLAIVLVLDYRTFRFVND